MIDFVKFVYKSPDVNVLLKDPDLDFAYKQHMGTGEIGQKYISFYKGMKSTILSSGKLLVQGSIHKFKNNGLHNHDDFTRSQIISVLGELEEKFRLNLRNCTLQNCEVGVNIIPPIPTKSILDNLFFHKRVPFRDGNPAIGTYKQATHREYLVKAYDKAVQYALPGDLFRFELKFLSGRELKKSKISTLHDLKDGNHLQNFCNRLLFTWEDDVLLYEPKVRKTLFTIRSKYKPDDWSNPRYWQQLVENKDCSRNRFSKEIKAYKEKMQYPNGGDHRLILECLYKKLSELILS